MSPTEAEISAVMDLAAASGVIVVPDRIKNLHRRVNSQATAVAVIGMVKRGKSTLLNRLVGVDVSAVAATPETASTIRVVTGPPSAWRSSNAGGPEEDLSADPSIFLEESRRPPDKNRKRAAGISGAFRLPEGLVLVDTPGVGDVAAELDDLYADIDEQWIEAGCGAAIVVINTGAGSYDLELYRRAKSTFPGAVEVVMKSTDNSVSFDDVCEYAEYIESQPEWNCTVLTVPDVVPDKAWGTSRDFGPLENLISELGERAAARIDVDIQFYERFVDQFIVELNEALQVDRQRIELALQNQPKMAPSKLIEAFQRCVRNFELADLDVGASKIITEIKSRTESSPPVLKSHISTLVKFAESGSEVAQGELIRLVLKFGNQVSQNHFTQVLSVLPAVEIPRLIREMPLEESKLVILLSSIKRQTLLREQVEEVFVQRVLRNKKLDQLEEIFPELLNKRNQELVLLEVGRGRLASFRELIASQSASGIGLLALRQRFQECQRWVSRTRDLTVSIESQSEFAGMKRELLDWRPKVLSLLSGCAQKFLGLSQMDPSQFRNRINALAKEIDFFELSKAERSIFEREFISLLIDENSPHVATEEHTVILNNWVNDSAAREQLLVQRGMCALWLFQLKVNANHPIDWIGQTFTRFISWEKETQSLSNPVLRNRRDQILQWMSDERDNFAKSFAPIMHASASELFTSIPTNRDVWLKQVNDEINRVTTYLEISEQGVSRDEVRNILPALESAKASWFDSAQGTIRSSSVRASNIHIAFGVGTLGALCFLIFAIPLGSAWLQQPLFTIGGAISSLALLLIFGIEYSVPSEQRMIASPPPPPSPIRRPLPSKVQNSGSSNAVMQRPHPFLYFLAAFGLVLCAVGLGTSTKDTSLSGSPLRPAGVDQSSTSIDRDSASQQTASIPGRSESESSSTPATGGGQSSSGSSNTTVTTSGTSSSGSASPSTTSKSSSSIPTTSSPPTTTSPPPSIPTASNQVASATNTGWGRYSVMVETRVTVPQGPDHLFSISGASAARYSTGGGSVQVSLTISVDGYFREHPGNGPTYFLTSPGQEVSKSYAYTIQLGPGTHIVQLLGYPHVPSPAVSFRAQSIRVADLGVVR